MLVLLTLCAFAWDLGIPSAWAQSSFRSLDASMAAYSARDFRRAATLARVAGDRAQGVERESARYLEGLALFKAGDLDAAATALRTASTSSDRFVAGQAGVTLGSVEIERKRFDAAGHAYRRAAASLEGAEATRAHSIAARCFDGAGMSALAQSEREAAGEPSASPREPAPSTPATAPSPAGGSTPNRVAVPAFKPGSKPPVRVVTEDDKPASNKPAPQIAAVRYAIQAGAYTTEERANAAIETLRVRCTELGLEAPRIIAKESDDGKTLHVIQFGNFPNRGVATRALLQFPRSAYKVEVYLAGADQAE